LKPSLNHRGALLAQAKGLTSSAAASIKITGLKAGETSAAPAVARGIDMNSKATRTNTTSEYTGAPTYRLAAPPPK
jgi:hypothetical protein